jgi:hypothetical protein
VYLNSIPVIADVPAVNVFRVFDLSRAMSPRYKEMLPLSKPMAMYCPPSETPEIQLILKLYFV